MTWTNTFALLHQSFATEKIKLSITTTAWIAKYKKKKFVFYKIDQLHRSKVKNDCSTWYEQIPVKFLKPVVEKVSSPIANLKQLHRQGDFSGQLENSKSLSNPQSWLSRKCKILPSNLNFTHSYEKIIL